MALNKHHASGHYHEPMMYITIIVHRITIMNLWCIEQVLWIGSLSWTCDQLNKYRAFDYYHEPVINRTSIVHRIAIMNLRCVEQIWCIGSLMNLSCMNKYHGSCNYYELEMHWTRWHWEVSFIESLITRHLNVGNCDAYERNVNIIENHYVFN